MLTLRWLIPLIATCTASRSTNPFQEDVLDVHNFYRRQHDVPDLTWNATLADLGASWSQRCIWQHSGGATGENLAAGYANVTAAIEAWALERVKYDFKRPGFDEDTGHFTQLVWGNTTTVGCAQTACPGGGGKLKGDYVVCEYWPAGNVVWSGKGNKNLLFGWNVRQQISGDADDRFDGTASTAGNSTTTTYGDDRSRKSTASRCHRFGPDAWYMALTMTLLWIPYYLIT